MCTPKPSSRSVAVLLHERAGMDLRTAGQRRRRPPGPAARRARAQPSAGQAPRRGRGVLRDRPQTAAFPHARQSPTDRGKPKPDRAEARAVSVPGDNDGVTGPDTPDAPRLAALNPRLPSPVREVVDARFERRGIRLLLKRDDLIHPELIGNKWRKLAPVSYTHREPQRRPAGCSASPRWVSCAVTNWPAGLSIPRWPAVRPTACGCTSWTGRPTAANPSRAPWPRSCVPRTPRTRTSFPRAAATPRRSAAAGRSAPSCATRPTS